ncbi:MAG: hypothetical protein V4662_11875 [Verrucomicrobiota bacterium]
MSELLHYTKVDEACKITSPEDGALVLAMMVIHCAIDDIRLHLQPPELRIPLGQRTPETDSLARRQFSARRAYARNAAAFLHGDDGRWWLSALEACGVPVPLNRLFRQLQQLKRRTETPSS